VETDGEQHDNTQRFGWSSLTGTYVGFKESGELIINTHSMASGYSNNKEVTKKPLSTVGCALVMK